MQLTHVSTAQCARPHRCVVFQDHIELADRMLSAADPEQQRMMEEACIAVTPEDVVVGEVSKKECTCAVPAASPSWPFCAYHALRNVAHDRVADASRDNTAARRVL
jgi:hypothetical protein